MQTMIRVLIAGHSVLWRMGLRGASRRCLTLAFPRMVSDLGFLGDWELEWTEGSDGYCWFDYRKITVGRDYPLPIILLLHELAHAVSIPEIRGYAELGVENNDLHCRAFTVAYENLVRRYVL